MLPLNALDRQGAANGAMANRRKDVEFIVCRSGS